MDIICGKKMNVVGKEEKYPEYVRTYPLILSCFILYQNLIKIINNFRKERQQKLNSQQL